MAYAVAFDGWDFKSHDVIVDTLDLELEESAEPAKSAMPDRAASPEASSSGLRITLGGTISAASGSPADLHAKYRELLAHTRGVDRLKRGQLEVYAGLHYWAQRLGTGRFSFAQGTPSLSWSLTFYADDPSSRAMSETVLVDTTSTSDPTVSVDFGTDLLGNATRIPLVLTSALPWVAGEVLRVENAIAGWRFEKVLERTIGAGEQLVVDGELHECLEGGEPAASGIAGTFPYLRGGVTNVLDFAGSDRHGAITVSFVDRYQG